MQCQVVGCKRDADQRLRHKYTGKVFCVECARDINKWSEGEEVIPFDEWTETHRLTVEETPDA